MQFYSRSNYPKTIPMPECSKNIPTFTLKINKETGKKELKKTGETNIYEKIQAGLHDSLIYNILERFEKGEVEVMSKMRGTYGDFTGMPKSLAEAQQTLIDAENTFMSLPLDIRKEFNHDPSQFVAGLSNGKFDQILAKINQNNKTTQKVENGQNNTNLTSQVAQQVQNAQQPGV